MIKVFMLKLPWSHWFSQVVWVQDPDSDRHFMCFPFIYAARGVFSHNNKRYILFHSSRNKGLSFKIKLVPSTSA